MVWGSMSAQGVGKLTFMDLQYIYISILKNKFHVENNWSRLKQLYYRQNNDSEHTALDVKLWLLYNLI